MVVAMQLAFVIVVAYLIGAIPSALIVGRLAFSTDVREHGSGNLGATNAWRALGWKAGVGVLLLDIGKGALAVWIAALVHSVAVGGQLQDWFVIVAAMAAVLGHSYSPYVRFAGGKGVATAAGALLVMMPLVWAIQLAVFLTVILVFRMVSLGSLVIAALFPVLVLVFYADRTPFILFAFLAAALVIWRHRSNIGRIIRGAEPKLSLGRKTPDDAQGGVA